MTQLAMTTDINGHNTFGLKFSGQSYNFKLTSGGADSTVTAPTSNTKGYSAVFSIEPGASVWVSTTTVALPSSATPQATLSQLNPGSREIAAGGVLHFNTNSATAEVGVSFYELS